MNLRTRVNVLVACAVLSVSACGPRQVEVRTAPTVSSQVSVEVNNSLTQGVNVYVVQNGVKTFVRQVGAGATQTISVPGVAAGSTGRLEATTVDGAKTYSRNVTLAGTVVFPVP